LAVYIKSAVDAFLKRNKPSSAERNSKFAARNSSSEVFIVKYNREFVKEGTSQLVN
jgi:hypothetical protein